MGGPRNGRSVETVGAELRAVESRANAATDPALDPHVAHLRREHDEALQARQRAFEDELMTMPAGALGVLAGSDTAKPPVTAG